MTDQTPAQTVLPVIWIGKRNGSLRLASATGLLNFVDPDNVSFFDHFVNNKEDQSFFRKEVMRIYKANEGNFREIMIKPHEKIFDKQLKEEAKAREAQTLAETATKAAQAQAEKEAREKTVKSYSETPEIQSIVKKVTEAALDKGPDSIEQALKTLQQLSSQNPELSETASFAQDVLTQYRRFVNPDYGLISRGSTETVEDRKGFLGIGKKEHQETKFHLNQKKWNGEMDGTKDEEGNYDLSKH